MSFSSLFNISSTFTLFLAPTGWGKTRMLLDLYRNEIDKIIFVSPLKALACEFSESCKNLRNVLFIEKRAERNEKFNTFLKSRRSLLILTPEMVDDNFLSGLEDTRVLVVLDEFHLFYYWGETFRPVLWEVCMGFANAGIHLLGLTATMGAKLLESWKTDFSHAIDRQVIINLGNQVVKNVPSQKWYFPPFIECSRKIFIRRFIYELTKKDGDRCLLYFCRFRGEVDKWINWCNRKNIKAVGCKGGEVMLFVEEMKRISTPRCIFATSALSHGVNLPSLSSIFISYQVDNKDFFLQMLGRGGRRGEKFKIYTFDTLLFNGWEAIFAFLKSIIFDLFVRCVLYFKMLCRYLY